MVQKKPLTPEELLEMDGKAVRVESETEYIPSGIYLCDVRSRIFQLKKQKKSASCTRIFKTAFRALGNILKSELLY